MANQRNRSKSAEVFKAKMRNREESLSWGRRDSLSRPEISPTLLEITTIYEKLKKGRDKEIHRLSNFGLASLPEGEGGSTDGENEMVLIVPTFPSNGGSEGGGAGSPNLNVRFLDFNNCKGITIRKYLFFSSPTGAILSDTLEALSPNYKELLKTEYYWLNITDPNESDLGMLFNNFNVHDTTITDIRETNTEEKIEFYEHYTFMSTRLLREIRVRKRQSSLGLGITTEETKESVDMDFNILLFKNFVITLHHQKWGSINDILGFANLVSAETELTPDWILYSIFIELAQDAQYLLAGIEPRLNELRVMSTFSIKEMSRILRENYEMEFQLYTIQRFLKPKVNILRTLKVKCGRRIGPTLTRLLNEIRDDFVEMNNDLRNLNHISERSQNTFLALVNVEKAREANEMSLAMKRFSQIALIFLPIQAIAGFFGMNVVVPFQGQQTTLYFWIIVLMSATFAIIMYLSSNYPPQEMDWTEVAVDLKFKPTPPPPTPPRTHGFWDRRRATNSTLNSASVCGSQKEKEGLPTIRTKF